MRLALLSLILLLWAFPANAGTVAIVRLPNPKPSLTEAQSRLHGELLSVGLEVKMINRPASHGSRQADPQAWLERLAADGGIDAVIDIIGDTAPVAVDVWVIEKLPRRLHVSRVPIEPTAENAHKKLAIRAVDVLRSTFLEKEMAAREQQSESTAEPEPTAISLPKPQEQRRKSITNSKSPLQRQRELEQPPNRLEHFGVEVGVAALTSLDRVGPALLPMIRLDWAARSWLVIRAALAGQGSRPTIATSVGTARVKQEYGILGGCYRFRTDKWWQPFLALSAGVLHTSVDGYAALPMQGHSTDQWSTLVEGSVGMELSVPDRYFLTVAGHVQMAEPYVVVHIGDKVVGTTGRPNLALTLTVGAWL